ncbi:MAG TPA: NYN domain-containing protein [Ktedonobacterales bacterium]
MSQATFDPTTPGGPADESSEKTSARSQNANPRRRSSRRGHAASAKTAENTTPTTTTTSTTPTGATEPAASASTPQQPATQPESQPAATPAAEEAGARGESRSRRSRGGAKRPAARGKAGAQLILTKPAENTQPEAPTAEGAAAAVEPTVEQPVAAAAESAAAEPVIVPVVSSGAEAPAPAAPRKLRFGLPRRLRQPETTPTPAEPSTPAATQPAPAAEVAPAEHAAPAAEAPVAEPARRYRFDRSRGATIPGAATPRPERLSGQRPGLYTGTAAELAKETESEQAKEPAKEPVFELPSLDELVGGGHGAELPTLAFEPSALTSPAATEPIHEEAEQLGEPAEAGELGESTGGTSRRRRRRRRGSAAHNGAHGAEAEAEELAEDENQPVTDDEPLEGGALEEDEYPFGEPSEPSEPSEAPYQEPQRETRGAYTEAPAQRARTGRYGYPGRATRRAPAEPGWGEAAPQQPAAESSPYSSPEPSFARGFGPTPSGVASPVRESYPRPSRIERGADTAAVSVAQLGSVIREAIGTQTDRLLNELRRQQPPAVTLSIPNAQTAERVGVFVDVANVVYSARGLRTSVDFGHLLDFLRANRRLARAQAYAPTAPEPGAEQAFLSAVKGMGYRITTKNYKTFSNGAKKADLDLDLCMDVVRIVEARAVDTIVLVSGDSDFLPLLDYCSDHGVRVEVAAFDDAASMILRQSCDLFINLSLVDGIRG